MKHQQKSKFTLLKIFVVVLIIGSLVVVSVRRHQRTVLKAHVKEMIQLVRTLEKTVDKYRLAGGTSEKDLIPVFGEKFASFNHLVKENGHCNSKGQCVHAMGVANETSNYWHIFAVEVDEKSKKPLYMLNSVKTNGKTWRRGYTNVHKDISGLELEREGFF